MLCADPLLRKQVLERKRAAFRQQQSFARAVDGLRQRVSFHRGLALKTQHFSAWRACTQLRRRLADFLALTALATLSCAFEQWRHRADTKVLIPLFLASAGHNTSIAA